MTNRVSPIRTVWPSLTMIVVTSPLISGETSTTSARNLPSRVQGSRLYLIQSHRPPKKASVTIKMVTTSRSAFLTMGFMPSPLCFHRANRVCDQPPEDDKHRDVKKPGMPNKCIGIDGSQNSTKNERRDKGEYAGRQGNWDKDSRCLYLADQATLPLSAKIASRSRRNPISAMIPSCRSSDGSSSARAVEMRVRPAERSAGDGEAGLLSVWPYSLLS